MLIFFFFQKTLHGTKNMTKRAYRLPSLKSTLVHTIAKQHKIFTGNNQTPSLPHTHKHAHTHTHKEFDCCTQSFHWQLGEGGITQAVSSLLFTKLCMGTTRLSACERNNWGRTVRIVLKYIAYKTSIALCVFGGCVRQLSKYCCFIIRVCIIGNQTI